MRPHHARVVDHEQAVPRLGRLLAEIIALAAGYQQAARRHHPGDQRAGFRDLLERIGARGLRPDDMGDALRAIDGQLHMVGEPLVAHLRPPFVLLRHVALHQAQPDARHLLQLRVGQADRAAGPDHAKQRRADRDWPPARPPAGLEQHRRQGAQRHRHEAQAVDAGSSTELADRVRARPDIAGEVPGKAAEQALAQRLGHDPGDRQGECCGARAAPAVQHGEPGRERRIERHAGAQRHHRRERERAEALGIGEERDRDPVQSDQKIAEAEPPAERERAAPALSLRRNR